MLNKERIVYLCIIIVTSVFLYVTSVNYKKEKESSLRMQNNLIELNLENSTLEFKTKELNKFLKYKETKQQIEIDSILKSHNVKVRNLIYLNSIKVTNLDTIRDTVTFKEPVILNDSLYKKEFKVSRKCLEITGHILTADTSTKVIIYSTK
jgi:hypothetical protein